MSSSQAEYRGRVQAQGDDIDKDQKGGYSRSWAQDHPVTDEDGLSFLDEIEAKCSKKQQVEREQAFKKARRFVKKASQNGGVEPHLARSFQDRKRTVKNARVDIEIHSGLTFIPVEKTK